MKRKIKTDEAGYILIHSPEHPNKDSMGYVREHRLQVEKKIGRLLLPVEVVHHLDSDKSNNKIENLMLFPNQGEHKKFENEMDRNGYATNPIKRRIENRWAEF